jgi:hypothetical protein
MDENAGPCLLVKVEKGEATTSICSEDKNNIWFKISHEGQKKILEKHKKITYFFLLFAGFQGVLT